MTKLYAERDIEDLDTYCDHVDAMTRENLHGKSAIAAELAYRDQRIKEVELDAARWNALINSPFRLFGFAGLDHDEPTKPCGTYGKNGYSHFGCEMWTTHDGYDTELGKKVLIGFADQAIKTQGANNV